MALPFVRHIQQRKTFNWYLWGYCFVLRKKMEPKQCPLGTVLKNTLRLNVERKWLHHGGRIRALLQKGTKIYGPSNSAFRYRLLFSVWYPFYFIFSYLVNLSHILLRFNLINFSSSDLPQVCRKCTKETSLNMFHVTV